MFRINNTQYFHFLQQADALRRSGSLCDAIISVKSHTFRAHRLVLACASRRLAQQLAQADADSPAHCTLEYFSPRTFQQVLDFTYTQAVEVSVEDLYLLLRAAQLLEMRPLEDQCRKQLDILDHRARKEEERGETKEVKEEKESAKDMVAKRKGSPVQEEELPESPSTAEKTSNSTVTENHSPPESAENHSKSPSPRKKPRLSPLSSAPHNSVITSSPPSSSSSSLSSSSSSLSLGLLCKHVELCEHPEEDSRELLKLLWCSVPESFFSSIPILPLCSPHVPTAEPPLSKPSPPLCAGPLRPLSTLCTKPLHWLHRDGQHHQAGPAKNKEIQPESVSRACAERRAEVSYTRFGKVQLL